MHRGTRGWLGWAGAALAAALIMSSPDVARAQGRPASVQLVQGLNFGTVFPGLPTSISRTDALNSGQVQIRGSNGSLVRVDFTLPAAMNGPGGATMPLSFLAGDGGYATTNSISTATAFDPNASLSTALSGQGRLYLFFGGRVAPPSQIAPGSYTATITITVTYI